MLTVCAWCDAILVDAPPGLDGEVSHGICEECLEKFEEDLSEEEFEAFLKNPLDPSAWKTERHRFDVPGETSKGRLGVHTTPSFDLAVAYAVHKASQEGNLANDEPNCGIVLELDMNKLTPWAEGDASIAAKDQDIVIGELKQVLKGLDVSRPENAHKVVSAVYKWSEECAWEREPTELSGGWWGAYWEEVVGLHDLNKLISFLGDLAEGDPRRLIKVLREMKKTESFPLDLWAESIRQYRYMVPISLGRLLSVHAVRPVNPDIIDTDDEDFECEEEGPQCFYLDDITNLNPDSVKIWDKSQEKQKSFWPKKRSGRVEFHGTDIWRARRAFPEIEEYIVSPWEYGQPKGVGPR